MVACTQRFLVLSWLLLILGWVAFWWDRSTAAAMVGLLVLVFGHSLFLAVEFSLAWWVGGRDPVRRPTPLTFAKAWLSEAIAAPRVFAWLQPFRWWAIPDHLPERTGRGAVLIHGFVCNRALWTPWLRELHDNNRAFVAVNLEPVLGSIDRYAQIIEAAVVRVTAATGQPPILICHSMGGLAARAWLRHVDSARVHRVVTIATPHRGTWLARFGRTPNSRQMRTDGDWLHSIADVPGSENAARFTCWYSDCDNIVFPPSVACLNGADNRLVHGRGHVDLAFDSALRRETLTLLND